jgi:DNA polymerase III epsilon subunit family exonuclease
VNIANSTLLSEIVFVSFDTETTGLNLVTDRLLDVGAVRFRAEAEQASFAQLVNPERSIPIEGLKVHHIDQNMVKNAPSAAAVLDEFLPFLHGAVLVAHNAPFDMGILATSASRARLECPSLPVVDSCLLAQSFFPDLPDLRLSRLMNHLGIAEQNTHRALPDARCAMRLFQHFLRELGNAATWGDLLARYGPPFRLDEFASLNPRDMWHHAVAVNALEERLQVTLLKGPERQRQVVRPRGFSLSAGRWRLETFDTQPEPIYMDEINVMSRIVAS